LAEYSYGFSQLEQHHKIGKKKKKHYSGDKFCGTSFDENLGKDVLFSEVLFLQQTCHFCLSKCGDFR
jgi:hypothetical protein